MLAHRSLADFRSQGAGESPWVVLPVNESSPSTECIAMRTFSALVLALLACLIARTSDAACVDAEGKEAAEFRVLAERLFLAYTNGRIKEYAVLKPVLCDKSIYVFVDATGAFKYVGRSWAISLAVDTRIVSIAPGE
jgi:hypothetical protein